MRVVAICILSVGPMHESCLSKYLFNLHKGVPAGQYKKNTQLKDKLQKSNISLPNGDIVTKFGTLAYCIDVDKLILSAKYQCKNHGVQNRRSGVEM